jgi:uncharacterized protein (TIGR03067 family)
MKLVRATILGLSLIVISVASADDKPGKLDPTKLVGDWVITEGMKAGEKTGEEATKGTIVITKDKITIKGDDMTFEFSYKLDTKADPVSIDMEIVQPEGLKGTAAKGIVAMADGKLKLCYHPMNGDRPKKFESTKDDGNYMFVMKKKDAK